MPALLHAGKLCLFAVDDLSAGAVLLRRSRFLAAHPVCRGYVVVVRFFWILGYELTGPAIRAVAGDYFYTEDSMPVYADTRRFISKAL